MVDIFDSIPHDIYYYAHEWNHERFYYTTIYRYYNDLLFYKKTDYEYNLSRSNYQPKSINIREYIRIIILDEDAFKCYSIRTYNKCLDQLVREGKLKIL